MGEKKMKEDFEAYKKVLEHRRKCKKWGKEFCLKCFGGGLSKFSEAILDEIFKEIEKRIDCIDKSAQLQITKSIKRENIGRFISPIDIIKELKLWEIKEKYKYS